MKAKEHTERLMSSRAGTAQRGRPAADSSGSSAARYFRTNRASELRGRALAEAEDRAH